MSDIKWIPLMGMDLSAVNLAAAEKLRRFGFAVICGEFGSEKLTKAGLCIYDVLAEKEKPNILLITSTRELYGWYRILMTGIGADFKIISGAPNALVFFDESCPNLYLMSADVLSGENILRTKVGEDFVWDLIVIDEEQNTTVPDYDLYRQNIPWKSEKLLITAPFPAVTDEDKSKLVSLINAVTESDVSEASEALTLDISACRLNEGTPVMRYFGKQVYDGSLKRDISFREYTFADDALNGLRRRVDLRTGVPSYRYGGNIFEEFDCEEYKKLYQKTTYTRSDVEDLRAFDKKLDCFLKLMDEIKADENNRAMVYCCDKNTVEYLRKVLVCVYNGSGAVRTAKGELFRTEDITRKLRVDDRTTYPSITIGVDGLGAVGERLDKINYIINYELPESAVLLERRMTRHGSAMEQNRHFVIFRDTNGQFDSRMLDKVLYGTIADSFCGELPTRNILLDIDIKGKCLNAVISDLKYIEDVSSQVDNCVDLIKRVKIDYALLGTQSITTGKQLNEFASSLLGKLYAAFGLSKDSTEEDISAAINALSGLCIMYDGKLEKVAESELSAIAGSFNDDAYLSQPFAAESVKGLTNAKAEIDEMHKSDNFHLTMKTQLTALNDCIQYPVLFGVWRYRVREQGSERSFRDYIRIYNDGI